MALNNRELEVKLEVFGYNLDYLCYFCKTLPGIYVGEFNDGVITGQASDYYFNLGQPGSLRVREDGADSQITLKLQDTGSIEDRVEIELPIGEDSEQGRAFLAALGFTPRGMIEKIYEVFPAPVGYPTVTVSTYSVGNRTFLEVEAEEMQELKDYKAIVTCKLLQQGIPFIIRQQDLPTLILGA